LLARIYGVYTVDMKGYKQVNLILMENTLRLRVEDDLMRIYDLKGSRVARLVVSSKYKPSTTLKDMNFFRNQSTQEVNLSKKDKKHLSDIIETDTQFLKDLNIMDYSMLLGVEKQNSDQLN
jgi:hypothetical protein